MAHKNGHDLSNSRRAILQHGHKLGGHEYTGTITKLPKFNFHNRATTFPIPEGEISKIKAFVPSTVHILLVYGSAKKRKNNLQQPTGWKFVLHRTSWMQGFLNKKCNHKMVQIKCHQ